MAPAISKGLNCTLHNLGCKVPCFSILPLLPQVLVGLLCHWLVALQGSREKVNTTHSCLPLAFPTSSDWVTWPGCIQCRSLRKCQTMAAGCGGGSGLGGRSCEESNMGSGRRALSQCAVGSQWASVKDNRTLYWTTLGDESEARQSSTGQLPALHIELTAQLQKPGWTAQ